jgi:uncharacterized membrane protein HdeD (DUF308 family)
METTLTRIAVGGHESLNRLTRNWKWILAEGVLLTLLGAYAMVYSLAASLVTVMALGYLVFFGGVLQIGCAFWTKEWTWFLLELLCGVFGLVLGAMIITRPFAAAGGITLFIALFLMVDGSFRTVTALIHRYHNWGFSLFNGVIVFALGAAIYAQWPTSSLWLLGTCLAVRLLLSGMGIIRLSVVLKALQKTA